jgi:hypothetical protein
MPIISAKTWLPGPSRGTTNFTSPGNITIPYGRYIGTISGRGGSGNAPTANYNTNYNTAYPIANRPIANQPAATWNTNYNKAYPIANQPIANQPATGSNPPFTGDAISYHQQANFNIYGCPPSGWFPPNYNHNTTNYQNHHAHGCPYGQRHGSNQVGSHGIDDPDHSCHGIAQIVAALNHHCNVPVPGNPNYTTNYNTNYNTVYPIANQPAATWNTNYNTNYNTVYPIANQPVANYNPGNAGAAASVLGVTLPGGPIDTSGFGGPPGLATPISDTIVSYYSYPDNATYPVTAPTGSSVSVKLE